MFNRPLVAEENPRVRRPRVKALAAVLPRPAADLVAPAVRVAPRAVNHIRCVAGVHAIVPTMHANTVHLLDAHPNLDAKPMRTRPWQAERRLERSCKAKDAASAQVN